VRDRLLRLTFRCAAERRLPIHIHTGGGDPDVVLRFARPAELFTLLSDFPEHPTVLIHSGNPWIEEAAYLASILPEVYLDMSVMLPWSSLAIDQKLEVLLGVAPPAKVLYGSDEASEPEVLWVSAHIARAALGRVLAKAVTDDWLTADEAAGIARAVLADNTRIVHGLPG
jgi:predicted TIM-barrel fold metal-dependent hydrolase